MLKHAPLTAVRSRYQQSNPEEYQRPSSIPRSRYCACPSALNTIPAWRILRVSESISFAATTPISLFWSGPASSSNQSPWPTTTPSSRKTITSPRHSAAAWFNCSATDSPGSTLANLTFGSSETPVSLTGTTISRSQGAVLFKMRMVERTALTDNCIETRTTLTDACSIPSHLRRIA